MDYPIAYCQGDFAKGGLDEEGGLEEYCMRTHTEKECRMDLNAFGGREAVCIIWIFDFPDYGGLGLDGGTRQVKHTY